jgi:hypothetical protein
MTVRYCTKGHWDDDGAPIYIGRPTISQFQRDISRQRLRLATVKFCEICGSEPLSACPECGTGLQHGSGEAPQHCRGRGKPFPWTAQTAVSDTVEDTKEESSSALTVSAPVSHVRAIGLKVKTMLAKAAPAAGEVAKKLAIEYVEKKAGLSDKL